MFRINKTPTTKVNLAKNPAGPFAPKRLSLLPLYAPRPIDELFWSKTAIVITTARTNCKIKNIKLTKFPLNFLNSLRLYKKRFKFLVKVLFQAHKARILCF